MQATMLRRHESQKAVDSKLFQALLEASGTFFEASADRNDLSRCTLGEEFCAVAA
jgi:hypothetical protein